MPRYSLIPPFMPTIRVAFALCLALAVPLGAQQGLDTVRVRVEKVTDGIYMLTGRGGNIGLSIGSDGAFIVDDQFAPLTEKIRAAVASVTDAPIRFVLNTHWHGDHTGGNENLGKAGALIVAHDNVRKRMSVDQFNRFFNSTTKASPPAALPVVTFTDAVTFHLNGDSIVATHIPPAHTDGDALVFFRKANVLHAGDTYFNGMYPFIDVASGGSVNGTIANADRMLGMMDANTKIIPGHGPLATATDLREYRMMLVTVRDRVRRQIARGATLARVKAARPSREFDEKWGKGFLTSDRFVELVFASLKGG